MTPVWRPFLFWRWTLEPRTYSYRRFSSPGQAEGSSLERQVEMARAYLARHPELPPLDEELELADTGVSAFRGAHALRGALGGFLQAMQVGHVAPGSFLIVESVDRLSRQAAWDAIPTLQALIAGGVTVITLEPERTFNRETLIATPWLIMEVLIHMIRAHEESATKSRRVRDAFNRKRAKLDRKPFSKHAPAWIRWDDSAGAWRVIEERAAVVLEMIELALQGQGQNRIAAHLNARGIRTFVTGRPWARTNVAMLLRSPALVGTYVPTLVSHVNGVRKRTPQEPIRNYWPAILDTDIWDQLQAVLDSRSGKRGRHAATPLRNIFSGLLQCGECGTLTTAVSKGRGQRRYLVCRGARSGACQYRSLRYDRMEALLLAVLPQLVGRAPSGTNFDAEIERAEGDSLGVAEELDRVVDALAKVGHSEALEKKLRKLEADQADADARLRDLRGQAELAQSQLVQARLATLQEVAAADPLDREALNLALKQAVRVMVVDWAGGWLRVEWRQGGEPGMVPLSWAGRTG